MYTERIENEIEMIQWISVINNFFKFRKFQFIFSFLLQKQVCSAPFKKDYIIFDYLLALFEFKGLLLVLLLLLLIY